MQRYFAKEKIEDKFILDMDDYYHIHTVMRMETNDKIEVVYNKCVYLCCIENVNKDIIVSIEKELVTDTDKMPHVVLCIPLLKEQKMDFIFQKATELGVTEIIPIRVTRSIIKLESNKEEKKLVRWTKICKEASEQSMRNFIPMIHPVKSLDDLAKIDGMKIVCSTTEKEFNLKKLFQKNVDCDKLVIVIGPEGGLSNEEENKLVSIGFTRVSLGSRIMRVETVPLFLLSVLNYNCME